MKNRVAVTGIGVVSPLGISIQENWEKIKSNTNALSRSDFSGSDLFPHKVCGSVRDFDPEEFVSNRKLLKLMNRESLLAAVAAKLAFDDASPNSFFEPENTGIYLGTGLTSGELDYIVPLIEDSIDEKGKFSYGLLGKKALQNCNPLLSFKILPNMALSYISILFNIRGQNMAFNPWSGNTGLGWLRP
jgi:3-oxoacyl-[acyl-carrier-protein] synthase II